MNLVNIILTISILLNTVFVLGVPAVLFVRFLIRRTKWWAVGQGAGGVVIREGRPRNGFWHWKGAGKVGLVVIDQALVQQAHDGRPVIWVDTDSATQISPKRLAELPNLPKELQAAKVEYGATGGFMGVASNDLEATTVQGLDGKPKKLSYTVWTRINGWRLMKTFRDIRVAQMGESNAGLWGALERMGPLIGLVLIAMLIILMVMVGRLG